MLALSGPAPRDPQVFPKGVGLPTGWEAPFGYHPVADRAKTRLVCWVCLGTGDSTVRSVVVEWLYSLLRGGIQGSPAESTCMVRWSFERHITPKRLCKLCVPHLWDKIWSSRTLIGSWASGTASWERRVNERAHKPGVAALGNLEPTNQVSDGAALLRAGQSATPHAQCYSNRRVRTVALPRGLKRVMYTPGCGSKTATWEGKMMVSGQNM